MAHAAASSFGSIVDWLGHDSYPADCARIIGNGSNQDFIAKLKDLGSWASGRLAASLESEIKTLIGGNQSIYDVVALRVAQVVKKDADEFFKGTKQAKAAVVTTVTDFDLIEANAVAAAEKLKGRQKVFTVDGVPRNFPIEDYLFMAVPLYRIYRGWSALSELKANSSLGEIKKALPLAQEWAGAALVLEKNVVPKLSSVGKKLLDHILESQKTCYGKASKDIAVLLTAELQKTGLALQKSLEYDIKNVLVDVAKQSTNYQDWKKQK